MGVRREAISGRGGWVGAAALLLLFALCLSNVSRAEERRVVEVTGLRIQAQGAGGATILVTVDGVLSDYESFALPAPPRLVIDIPYARLTIPQPVIVPAGSPILEVRTTQYRERPVPIVRLVFDLGRPLPYRLEITGNKMEILVSEEASEEVPRAQESRAVEQPVKVDEPKEATTPAEPAAGEALAPSPAETVAPSPQLAPPTPQQEKEKQPEAKPSEAAPLGAERAMPEPVKAPVPARVAALAKAKVVGVTGLQVQAHGAAGATVVVSADGQLSDYKSFLLPDPPRLVIDVPHARHAIRQPITLPAGSPIQKVRTTQYRQRPIPIVRLVFDLGRALPFKTEKIEKGLEVFLGEVPREVAPPPAVAEAPQMEKAPKAQPPARRKPLPPAMARRPKPDLRPLPSPEAPAVATLPVPPAAPEQQFPSPPPITPKAPLGNSRLSLDFRDADLKEILLKVIHEASGLNIVLANNLENMDPKDRRVSVRLMNVEWRQALDLVLRTRGLSYEQDGNVIYVGSKSDIQKSKEERAKDIQEAAIKDLRIREEKQKVEEEQRKREEERRKVESEREEERRYAEEPRCTKLIPLAYTKAAEIKKHLDPLKTRRGRIELDERTNTIIVNDAQSVCLKMAAIAKELDAPPKDPLVTKLIPFNYAKATDLKTNLTALKTPQGSVVVDERSSRVIIKDLPPAVEKMEGLLKQIDIPTPQVLIEARIVEASRNFSQSLGVQWGGGSLLTSPGSKTGATVFGGSNTPGVIQFPSLGTTPSPFPTGTNTAPFLGPVPLALNLPAIAAGANPFVLGTTIGSLANRFLVGVQLSAAEREGRIRTLSSPRVATQDNEEAEIKQGTQVPFTTIDPSGRTVVSFQDAFIKLKVKPHITPDGRVSMKVEAERSFAGDRIDFLGGFAFPINTRKATTNILVPNGSTVVIGGLLQSTEQVADDRVPVLGRIPILGWLFKRETRGPDERVELLIFLTPSVLQESRL